MRRLRRFVMLACLVSAGAPAFAQSAPADKTTEDRRAADSSGTDKTTRNTGAEIQPASSGPSASAPAPDDLKPYAAEAPNEGSETVALVGQFVKTLVALGIVIGIIYFLAKIGVARFIPGGVAARAGKLVRVVERVAVDQKNSLVVVEVGNERLLLSAGERGLHMVAQLGQGEAGPSFKTVLGASRVGSSNDAS